MTEVFYICVTRTRVRFVPGSLTLESHRILLSQRNGLCDLPRTVKYNATNCELLMNIKQRQHREKLGEKLYKPLLSDVQITPGCLFPG